MSLTEEQKANLLRCYRVGADLVGRTAEEIYGKNADHWAAYQTDRIVAARTTAAAVKKLAPIYGKMMSAVEQEHFCRRVREAAWREEPLWKRFGWDRQVDGAETARLNELHLVARRLGLLWKPEIVDARGYRVVDMQKVGAFEYDHDCKAALHDAAVKYFLSGLRAAHGVTIVL